MVYMGKMMYCIDQIDDTLFDEKSDPRPSYTFCCRPDRGDIILNEALLVVDLKCRRGK